MVRKIPLEEPVAQQSKADAGCGAVEQYVSEVLREEWKTVEEAQ